jgi:hypothetical protein
MINTVRIAGIGQRLGQRLGQTDPAEAFRPGPEIRLASLGEAVVPTGAIELARQKLR